MPALRRALVALVVLAGCAPGSADTTADSLTPSALQFARSADRALAGTRFATVEPGELAAAIVTLCRGAAAPELAVAEVIAGLSAAEGAAADDTIVTEVLLTGVAAVCPERSGDSTAATYLADVAAAVENTGGAVLTAAAVLTAGLSACEALDVGEPGDAVVAIAAVGLGVEASLPQLLGGVLTEPEAVTLGAILTASAVHLCPQHAARVAEFVNDLTG